jgi:hypothetical protein
VLFWALLRGPLAQDPFFPDSLTCPCTHLHTSPPPTAPSCMMYPLLLPSCSVRQNRLYLLSPKLTLQGLTCPHEHVLYFFMCFNLLAKLLSPAMLFSSWWANAPMFSVFCCYCQSWNGQELILLSWRHPG